MSSEYAELSCALCGEDNHTTLYHAKMLETERDLLRSQNAKAEKDAARYRWLRENIEYGSSDFDLWYQLDVDWGDYHKDGDKYRTKEESLDAAIDAALARVKP